MKRVLFGSFMLILAACGQSSGFGESLEGAEKAAWDLCNHEFNGALDDPDLPEPELKTDAGAITFVWGDEAGPKSCKASSDGSELIETRFSTEF